MGLTFIGNPFDQDNSYDDSDWEMNADEEWVTPPQDIALVDMLDHNRFNIILGAGADLSEEDSDPNWQESNEEESDDDYEVGDDIEYSPDNEADGYVSDQTEHYFYDDTDEEEIDYVTYPIEEPAVSADKPTSEDNTNTGENTDAD